MRHLILFIAFGFILSSTMAQSWGDSSYIRKPLFYAVEKAPQFPGGMSAYYKFLSENLKMPENKFASSSHRLVTVRIVINTEGKIAYAEIEKGVNDAYNLAALDLIKSMPDWIAGTQNGHKVPVSLSLPFLFVD
jgi:hypothetical protein